jgi:hypothetical protein
MATVFENLSEKFHTAFLELDPDSRRMALEAWIKDATPIVQSAVKQELRAFVEMVLNNGKEERAWRGMAEKFSYYADRGKALGLEFTIRSDGRPWTVVEKLSPEVRARTIEVRWRAFPEKRPAARPAPQPSASSSGNGDDYDDAEADHGRSANDDRSDSMNPNNDAYQASMDNRSDQMNPNNDAYWSSRGR